MTTRRRHSQDGFTLLELMVALTAGMIVIGSIYFIGGASQKHFQTQQKIAQTQLAVRMAMEQLRRDISSAGNLVGPDNSLDNSPCSQGTLGKLWVWGIRSWDNTGFITNAAANGSQADRLVIGTSVTGEQYPIDTSAGNRVFLSNLSPAYRRTLIDPPDAWKAPADGLGPFRRVFQPGRMMRLRTTRDFNYTVTITASDDATRSVTFTPNVSGGCYELNSGWAIPMVAYEYSVFDFDSSASGGNLNWAAVNGWAGVDPNMVANAMRRGSDGEQLVRREVDATFGAAPWANTERVVLDYVVDFNVDLLIDANYPALGPINLQRVGAGAGTPRQTRGVVVRLAARTAEQDPAFPFLGAPPIGQPMTRFQVNADQQGAARVRQMEIEVFTPNLARNVGWEG